MNQAGFTLIAHRGFSSRAPENTFAAFDLALREGFDHFELDVRLTADGAPVVIHDATLDRTTDGSGPVAAATLEEILRLDAGLWFQGDDTYRSERIPTLADLLERYREKAHIHLELKSSEPELPTTVAAMLGTSGWLDVAAGKGDEAPGLAVISFNPDQLRRSKAVLPPDVRHSWLVERIDPWVLDEAEVLGVAGILPRTGATTAGLVRAAKARGFAVHVWDVRDPSGLDRLLELGISGATVDWPDVARDHLRGLFEA